jgi:hypothetical protein
MYTCTIALLVLPSCSCWYEKHCSACKRGLLCTARTLVLCVFAHINSMLSSCTCTISQPQCVYDVVVCDDNRLIIQRCVAYNKLSVYFCQKVVKHRGTGVEYAMKTLRLNRLDDFQKLDELRNEIDVMSSLK